MDLLHVHDLVRWSSMELKSFPEQTFRSLSGSHSGGSLAGTDVLPSFQQHGLLQRFLWTQCKTQHKLKNKEHFFFILKSLLSTEVDMSRFRGLESGPGLQWFLRCTEASMCFVLWKQCQPKCRNTLPPWAAKALLCHCKWHVQIPQCHRSYWFSSPLYPCYRTC